MDLVKSCLIVSLALVLLAHAVLSAPTFTMTDDEDDMGMPMVIESAVSALRERRDADEPGMLLTRLRRQVRRSGNYHYNDYNPNARAHRRWLNRFNRYRNRNLGGGQIADA